MNLRPGGMTIVQQQGMEVLGVESIPVCAYHLVGRISRSDREAYECNSGRIPRSV